MRKYASLASLLLAALAGCTTSVAPDLATYGNFTASSIPANDVKMAADASRKLVAMYPPAKTRFALQQTAGDAFGIALTESLRRKGFALQEYAPTDSKGTASRPSATPLRLGYVLDLVGTPNLYRVTLQIGDQSLTRAYLVQDGSIFPAGSWVRKE